MKTAKAITVIAAVLGCVGCVWAPGGSDEPPSDERERGLQQESQDAGEPDAAEDPADSAALEPPLAQAELEPLLTDAFEGLYEGLVLLRRGDIEVDVLFDYATRGLIEQQLRVFGSSIPADYVIDGLYSVAGLDVPNVWENGDTVTAHVCIDHDDVRILDADGVVLDTEPTSRFTASTVLFELSEDEDKFLVADILSLFPDASDPCPAA